MYPDFYLAGGTALVLQLGHRISYDLGFFSPVNSLGMVERSALAHRLQSIAPTVIKHEQFDRPDFTVHLAYALRYFDDAENDTRELHMLQPVKWSDVKKYCIEGSNLLSKLNTGLEPPK